MKTNDEFKAAVYRKREARRNRRKAAGKRLALFGIPSLCVAALLTALPLLVPGGPQTGAAGENGGRPGETDGFHGSPCLQVLTAEPPEDLSLMALSLEREKNAPRDYVTTSELKAQEKEEEKFAEERLRRLEQLDENAVDPAFPAAVNRFARDSSALLEKNFGENGCYSPLSLYYALALAGSGARNETEREFLEVLNAPDLEWLSGQCGKYYRQKYHDNPFSQFQIANSLWLDGQTAFEEGFLDGARENFYASLFQADFANPALGAEMGRWISENTNGLLSPELTPSPMDRLAVINTVYLYDQWVHRFSQEDNTREPFTKADGSTVTAEYLHSSENSQALRGDGFTRASLGLRETGEMIFILPDEGVTVQDLLAAPQCFEEMFFPKSWEEFQDCMIEWSIPKFSFGSEWKLNEMLPALGLETAFDREQADFKGISSFPEPLYLSSAQQGVRIGIDENGVEAASYTALMMSGAGAPPTEIVEMKLDRPFLFAILSQDRLAEAEAADSSESGTLLFVGVCGNPAAD